MTVETTSALTLAQRTQRALQEAHTQLNAVRQRQHEPIAIVGMACRFPGADTPEEFWELLRSGRDMIQEVPGTRWAIDDYYAPLPPTPGKMYVREAGFLDAVDQFEPLFFNISPREAASMDPQQRILLEVAWEALERAGIASAQLIDSQTGVFVGITENDYARFEANVEHYHAHAATGNGLHFAAGRLSYALGLQGPNLAVDTACSSSLVAVHLACQSLRLGECDLALAGAILLILTPDVMVGTSQLQAYAPDGRCKTFDAAADGFGRGEGCGIVVLKRLSDAISANDQILAVIRGSAVNHDGPSSGLTTPNKLAQEALLRRAHQNARIQADDVSYVETHGTGTQLGDPVEVRALAAVFGTSRPQPLRIGSVKTNIGHLEPASGMAGLFKVVLSLQHGEIPPHLHFHTPNPHIDWQKYAIQVPTEVTPWLLTEATAKRIAGVSAFGMSGTNAHLVVQEAPARPLPIEQKDGQQPWHILTVSAKSENALKQLVSRYAKHLAAQSSLDLADICYTANTGRNHFVHRLSIVAASPAQLQSQLTEMMNDRLPPGVTSSHVSDRQVNAKIAFLFTGQGAQSVNMGQTLYQTQPIFRHAMDRCDEILRPLLGESLLALLYPDPADEVTLAKHHAQLALTTYTQPALFAIEYALAQLWLSWGIEPDYVMGHSVGEYVAACVAGVFSLEDGLKLIAARAQLMGALPAQGRMVAVATDITHVEAALAAVAGQVVIAAYNAPESIVISGADQSVTQVIALLQEQGIKTQPLTVSHAFHSPLMQPMLAEFARIAQTIVYHRPQIQLVSNLTGRAASNEIATPAYWVRHVCEPVRFADSIATLQQAGVSIFLEIGPKPTLLGLAQQCVDAQQIAQQPAATKHATPLYLPSLRPNQPEWQTMLESLGSLFTQHVQVNWQGFYQKTLYRKVTLPTYPFQRERYWVETSPKVERPVTQLSLLLDRMVQLPSEGKVIFEVALSTERLPFLKDHIVFNEVVVPGAFHTSVALDALSFLFPGQRYQLNDIIFANPLALHQSDVRTEQIIFTFESVENKRASGVSPSASPGVSSGVSFRVISFIPNAPEETMLTHTTGRIVFTEKKQSHQVSLATLHAQHPQAVARNDVYEWAKLNQVLLGPCFQWLTDTWLGEKTTLARMAVPAAIGRIANHPIHPAMLDSSFLASAMINIHKDLHNSGTGVFLPFGVESVELYAPFEGNEWWCYTQEVSARCWNIQLFDAAGIQVAAIKGYFERPVTTDRVRGAAPWQKWLYTMKWQPLPARSVQTIETGTSVKAAMGRHWLILADQMGVGTAVANLLEQQGERAIVVQPGLQFQQISEQFYRINPESATDYDTLLRTLPALYGVIQLWSLDAELSYAGSVFSDQNIIPGAANTWDPIQSARLSCHSTLYFVQYLLKTHPTTPFLWLVTRATQAVVAGDQVVGITQSPLWGLGRTIAQEHPEFHCVCLDLEANTSQQQDAATLLTELLSVPFGDRSIQTNLETKQEDQIAYRKGQRYGLRLTSYTKQPEPTLPQSFRIESAETGILDHLQPHPEPRQFAIAKDKTYLITGGLGGLGLEMARSLTEQGAKHLILLGRSHPTLAAKTALAELEQQGIQIIVAQVDIAVEEQIGHVINAIDPQIPLAGIVHAAGVLDDGSLLNQSWERFVRVLRPKVLGAWNLHKLTINYPLDFFIFFSSSAGILNGIGQANYAAANVFLDSFAHYRQAAGLPSLAIDWGAWSEIGMAASLLTKIDQAGEQVISPKIGRQIFATLLSSHVGQVAVLPITDMALFQQKLAYVPPLLTDLLPLPTVDSNAASASALPEAVTTVETKAAQLIPLAKRLAQLTAKQAYALLVKEVEQKIRQVLKLPATQQLDPYQRIFDLGMDSLLAIELRSRLQKVVEAKLPTTLVFDYPSVMAITNYLASDILNLVDTTMPAESRESLEYLAAPAMSLMFETSEIIEGEL